MAFNSTSLDLPPLPGYVLKPLPPLIAGISDTHLALACPVIAYWATSLIFHWIDEYDMFPQYRLHTPQELLKRNKASRWDVLRDVILQQIIQTVMGVVFAHFDPISVYGKEEYDVSVWAQRIRLAQRAWPHILALVGVNAEQLSQRLAGTHSTIAGAIAGGYYPHLRQSIDLDGVAVVAPAFATWELFLAKSIYWVVVPTIQFVGAVLILDTWQYFLHRAMHLNKWLYTKFHSRHHRLYVPYAYGALYNHPFEGFLLDTCGSGLAYLIVGMTARQCMVFFTFAICKTVDDHCGYALPWDPLQHISGNNAAYHDIHHQSWGTKTNFSQPFFTFWDRMLGTIWKGGNVEVRYEKSRVAADEWWDKQRLKAEGQAAMDADLSGCTPPSSSPLSPTLTTPVVRRSPWKPASGNQTSLRGLKDRVSVNLPQACHAWNQEGED